MGTRRSRHNKGRKPLYKHFERDTVRTFSFDDEKPAKEKYVPPPEKRGTYTAPRTAKVIELEASVARFMANRPKPPMPDEPKERMSERVATISPEMITVSQADVLLQLFHERKITVRQLQAGRAWQFNLHSATLQPTATIAWDHEPGGLRYQERGSVSEAQWEAMRRRRAVRDQLGGRFVDIADYCLGSEWRRAALMDALGVDGKSLERGLGEMLSAITLYLTHANKRAAWRAPGQMEKENAEA